MEVSVLAVRAVMVAMAGWLVLVVPGARGTEMSEPEFTCDRVRPVFSATASTTTSPCRTVAAVSGLVPAVWARLPIMVVA